MVFADLLKHLSIIAFVLEVLHRLVTVIMNLVRLVISPEYREEIFGEPDEVIEGHPV